MSQLRHHFIIVLDGTKHEIVTSARDLAGIEADPDANAADQTWRLLHAACQRLKIAGVPKDWETFADLLDDMTDLEPELATEVNPTQPAPTAG